MKIHFTLSLLALGCTAALAGAQNQAPKTGKLTAQSRPSAPKAAPKARPLSPKTGTLARQTPRGGNQGGETPANPLAGAILNAERNQDADSLLLAYGQAVTDPALARAAIAQLLASYYQMRNGAQTAEQATQAVAEANLRFQVLQSAQNQIMVQQNQQLLQQQAQIIALLQQQARPR